MQLCAAPNDLFLVHLIRCLAPLIINHLVEKIRGGNLLVNGYKKWCPQYALGGSTDLLVYTVDEQQLQNVTITVDISGSIFLWATVIFVFIDFTWILCVWSAASIGTPTQSMGRDAYLKPLIIYKMLAVNVFPILLLALGIAKVVDGELIILFVALMCH